MSKPVRHTVLKALVICVATLVIYTPALKGGFVWDDAEHVTENRALRTTEGLREIWTGVHDLATMQYYPLTFSTFWAEYQLWGDNPLGYHWVNVMLHMANALLVWALFARLRIRGAWLAGLIFAVHPIHVMSVAWITELKNVLSGFFYLLALHAYFGFSGLDKPADPGAKQWALYGLAVAAFALALLSKTATCLFPLALLLVLWWRRGPLGSKEVTPVIPLIFMGAGMGFFTLWVETHLVGAKGGGFGLLPLERVIVAGRSFWFYIHKFLWPHPLVFFYERWTIDSSRVVMYIAPAAAALVLFGLWSFRAKIGRGPFAVMLYFAIAGPFLVLVQVLYMMKYTFVSDHWLYFASPAIIALTVAGLSRVFPPGMRAARAVAGTMLIAVLMSLSWSQAGVYEDIETMYRDSLSKNPKCWLAAYNLGVIRMGEGRTDEALELYDRAIEMKPDYFEAYNNSGTALAKMGRMEEAEERWQRCLEVAPGHSKALFNLAGASLHAGRNAQAIEYYEAALSTDPGYDEARRALIDVLTAEGREDEARPHRQRLGI